MESNSKEIETSIGPNSTGCFKMARTQIEVNLLFSTDVLRK